MSAKYVGPPLPPFNTAAVCPKCGHNDAYTRYHRAFDATVDNGWDGTGPQLDHEVWYLWQGADKPAGNLLHPEADMRKDCEHLHRECARCHYEWLEMCIEQVPTEAKRGHCDAFADGCVVNVYNEGCSPEEVRKAIDKACEEDRERLCRELREYFADSHD